MTSGWQRGATAFAIAIGLAIWSLRAPATEQADVEATDVEAQSRSRTDACAEAEAHWKSAEAIATREAFEDHLSQFPDCAHAGQARTRIEALAGSAPASDVNALGPTPTKLSDEDLSAVKVALELARRGKADEATALKLSTQNPLAVKLIEWAVLRNAPAPAGIDRYVAFINANARWPSIALLRRRAETALWDSQTDAETVRAFFASAKPMTAKGRLALARALNARGDRAGTQALVREAWRGDALDDELERQALEMFRELLTPADHKARMDRRFHAKDVPGAMRAAQRLGGVDLVVAQARVAVISKSTEAGKLLDAVPEEARRDPGYLLARIQWLVRQDRVAEAAQLMLAVPRDPSVLHSADEWWVEQRLIARKLLDAGDPRTAYQVARNAVPPARESHRGDHEFMAGWIALRFLNDPAASLVHFAQSANGTDNPIARARAAYWQGRATEALGKPDDARNHFVAAAQFPMAYYGQLARARLGQTEIALRDAPAPTAEQVAAIARIEAVRAIEVLYALDERDLAASMAAEMAERHDVGALKALCDLAVRHGDARAMLLIGRTAVGRGLPFDHYAYPTTGVPDYMPVGPAVDPSVIYSVVRQESAFNPRSASSANALGLLQVTPDTGRYIARKFKQPFDEKRLRDDVVYNTQLGAAVLGAVMEEYRGSYILGFAAYNAGRGRVKEWIERYGDPRDPKVDPVDWVERIPYWETSTYIQRVLANLQVYRVRFGSSAQLMIDADLRRGATN